MEDKLREVLKKLDLTEKILDMIPQPVFYKDTDGRYLFFNDAFLAFRGMTYEEVYGKTAYDIAPPERAKLYTDADGLVIDEKKEHVIEVSLERSDGSLRQVEITKVPDMDNDGNVLGILCILKDIDDRKKNESRLLLADRMKEALLTLNRNIINYGDESDFFSDVIQVFQELFGRSQRSSILEIDEEGMVRIIASRGYDKEDTSRFLISLEETFIYQEGKGDLSSACIINDLSRYFQAEILPSDESVEDKFIKSSLEIPILVEKEVRYIISIDSVDDHVFNDDDLFVANYIRSQFQILLRVFKLYQDTLHMSRYDTMTGLMNRRYFDETLEALMMDVPSDLKLCLVIFDLDRLKQVNDLKGHDVGDLYIRHFGDYLKESFKEAKAIGRIGGDEFAAVFEVESFHDFKDRLEASRMLFCETSIDTSYGPISGAFSYGMKVFDDPSMTRKSLFRGADEAMYRNKKAHR